MATSTLNPLANTFVPSNPKVSSEMVSLGKISTKSMAAKLIQDLVESKKENSDKSITKEEIIVIVEKLISLRHEAPVCDTFINTYLAKKVPNVLSLKPLIPTKQKDQKIPTKIKSFDLSAFRIPKLSMLLVSFWGLYRQEQALRPMLSLTLRPQTLEDKIWSVTSKDLKVWNTRAVESPCSCPPMFGYTIPAGFFGNLFPKESNCSIESIHLNRYPETEAGNEFVSIGTERSNVLWPEVFADIEDGVNAEKDLEYYTEQFKTIVSTVCGMVSDEDEGVQVTELLSHGEAPPCNFTELLWDTDSTILNRRPMSDEIAEDDNCHPLLDAKPIDEESTCEGVAFEVKEMIRRSLSSDSDTDSATSEEASRQVSACDPPCSFWCQSSPKSASSSEVISMLNDTTRFLLDANGCVSSQPPSSSAFESGLNHSQRPYFKRSFSANDCDFYYETSNMPSASSREALAFLRKDPINFFKNIRDRNDSWRDNDSGIVSHCSSHEDVFCDNGSEVNDEQLADSTPMWSFFSGEGSLWKPLPSIQDEANKFSHKRVKELRRQKSIN